MTATMRSGRVDDVPQLIDLWRREVAGGRPEVVPDEKRFRHTLGEVCRGEQSPGGGDAGRLKGSVLVASRPSPAGVLANVYAAGDGGVYAEMAQWGVLFSRATGASIVQLFAGTGHGADLASAGLRSVRPWWRMDRRLDEGLPAAAAVDGYRVVDATLPTAGAWADLFNRSFADHWRFAPRGEAEIVGDRSPELCLMAVTAGEREPVALALAEVERFAGDPRPQPIGVISSVGTVPEHRRKGLARLLVSQLLARCRAAGAASASLYVDGQNSTRAADLYRNLGFDVTYTAEVWEATFP